ncbi:MAG: hypothetical protein AAGG50_12730 [Bacteroidota bacterium]
MRLRFDGLLLVALCFSATSSLDVAAQRGPVLYGGGHVGYVALSTAAPGRPVRGGPRDVVPTNGPSLGATFGLEIGRGFSVVVQPVVVYLFDEGQTLPFTAGDIGIRWQYERATRTFSPYVEAGHSFTRIFPNTTGQGLSVGAGFVYLPVPTRGVVFDLRLNPLETAPSFRAYDWMVRASLGFIAFRR